MPGSAGACQQAGVTLGRFDEEMAVVGHGAVARAEAFKSGATRPRAFKNMP